MINSPRASLQLHARLQGSDIAKAALSVDLTPAPRSQVRRLVRGLKVEADVIRTSANNEVSDGTVLSVLNVQFFSNRGYLVDTDSAFAESSSTAVVLANRRGSCVGLAIVYLALAQRLGLVAHAVATPVHLFVRVQLPSGPRNVELMEGGQAIDDFTYRRRYKIDDASIASGAFMADLTNDQVIAHLLSNQAVALSKQGKLDEALARYDKALKLHPKLVAAWCHRPPYYHPVLHVNFHPPEPALDKEGLWNRNQDR